jgi:putative alpha-1,2-mannosidase
VKKKIYQLKQISFIVAAVIGLLLPGYNSSAQKETADYVDPLLGTSSSRWMLFPGPCLPFGMVKLSPDNTDEGQYKLGAGYEYNINSITGFGHVHSWMMGSFVTMPTTGEIKIAPGNADNPDSGYRSRINNKNTEASAGYYSTILEDYDIKAELTATTRGGF